MSKNGLFSVGDHVVYPAHGVGQVQGIETQEVAGLKLEVYVITFDHEKMTLRVPTAKAKSAGLRPHSIGLPFIPHHYLFVSKSDHRVYFSGAACREITREKRNGRKQ